METLLGDGGRSALLALSMAIVVLGREKLLYNVNDEKVRIELKYFQSEARRKMGKNTVQSSFSLIASEGAKPAEPLNHFHDWVLEEKKIQKRRFFVCLCTSLFPPPLKSEIFSTKNSLHLPLPKL